MDFEPLLHLLKASSKKVVQETLIIAFMYRNATVPEKQRNFIAESLEISSDEVEELFTAATRLIKTSLFKGLSVEGIPDLFPSSFNEDLAALLARVIETHHDEWRAELIEQRVSLPRLLEMDWRVDIKSASSDVSSMSIPTALISLKVEDPDLTSVAQEKSVVFELPRETLDTMLDGMTKIKDQLSSIAK
eukprot:GCRY01002159.1.p1 GENE.GCRY01002159.1~~GCRY01002159.1.p1  ORF type:complete len:190 (+),score=45.95 GCRY01002159.1:150-719(+)